MAALRLGVGLVTLPERRQRVQTRTCRWTPFITARTRCRFGLNRRWVTLWAWLTRLPNMGALAADVASLSHELNLQGPSGATRETAIIIEPFAAGQAGRGLRRRAACYQSAGARVLSVAARLMVQFNFSERTIKAKVVYYGPAQSGKTTNLEQIHRLTDPAGNNRLISLNTAQDRTLFFDLLPFSLGAVAGLRLQGPALHRPRPGPVQRHPAGGAGGGGRGGVRGRLPQVAAQGEPGRLREHEGEPARQPPGARRRCPLVLQYNKQDLPDVLSEAELSTRAQPVGPAAPSPRWRAQGRA